MWTQKTLLSLAVYAATVVVGQEDRAQYALTDTGSINGGNTFPGVARPLGMVKLGPDLYTGTDSYSGYQPTGSFTGFTMLHGSGTGGAPKYGVVSQMPVVGDIVNPLSNGMSDTRASVDISELGYYKASLGSGTVLEMSAGNKAGLYKYTFPQSTQTKNVLVDVSHVLASYRGQGLEQHFLGGNITVGRDQDSDRFFYTGFGTYDNGWNRAEPWRVYFCGRFNQPSTYKTFIGADLVTDNLFEFVEEPSYESETARLGAVFSFTESSLVSRVGVSFISTDQACSNIEDEITEDMTLEDVRDATRAAWNTKVFSKVSTSETNVTKLNQLYTALYFMHLMPTNKTGENPLWESDEPYYDDIFTFWDIYRSLTPLLHVLQPEYYEELIRSMIDVWRHDGWVSDARSSLYNGAVQGGTNGDIVFADAYVKGVRGKVNWEDAFSAMVKNAEVVPDNNNDWRDPTGSTKEGRSALPDWLDLGFITPRFGRSVSRAVEYSVNDFSLATVALGLGRPSQFETYYKRSHNWRNHWNKDMTALNFTGFLGPRNKDGFIAQDPLSCGRCYWPDLYYQGLPWEYSFNAHHDIETMVELMGGAENFVERLEMTFTPGVSSGNAQFGRTLFNPGNQPSFQTPYLYSYVNRQDLSVQRSRFVAKSYFHPTPGGLPGNSDAGAMESWLLWNMIGLYPMTGQPIFFIGSPWFSDLTIDLGAGKKLEITAEGADETTFYVQSLKVNGEQWDKTWVSWDDIFAEGGKLEFVLGKEQTQWATGERPPSPGSHSVGEAKKLISGYLPEE